MSDLNSTQRVVRRFMAFKHKEKKRSKIERLRNLIREKTGIGRGTAEDIADAIIRKRDLDRLAAQKKWPAENGTIEGPKGTITFEEVRETL